MFTSILLKITFLFFGTSIILVVSAIIDLKTDSLYFYFFIVNEKCLCPIIPQLIKLQPLLKDREAYVD